MHPGPAELLVVGVLPGGHLHQRRPAEEHLRAAVDHHDVVAHARDVGPAGGGVAEDQGDRRDARRGQLGDVTEDPAARQEDLRLGGQVGPAGLHEVDERQPVAPRRLQRPADLAQRVRVRGAAAHGRVVGDDHALHAGDHTDTADQAGADGEVAAPPGQGGQLQERRTRVDQQGDPFTGEQLAPFGVTGGGLRASTGDRDLELPGELVELLQHRIAVLGEDLGVAVDRISEDRHRHPFGNPVSHPRLETMIAMVNDWPLVGRANEVTRLGETHLRPESRGLVHCIGADIDCRHEVREHVV